MGIAGRYQPKIRLMRIGYYVCAVCRRMRREQRKVRKYLRSNRKTTAAGRWCWGWDVDVDCGCGKFQVLKSHVRVRWKGEFVPVFVTGGGGGACLVYLWM